MKYMLAFCAAVLCAAVLITCFPVHGEEQIYSRIIRLHVIAESDSEEDQARKLLVRDAVLQTLDRALSEIHSYENAEKAIQSLLPAVEAAAAEAAGYACPVRAELGREQYPIRCYEEFTLPAGEYTSLRIVLGEGEGKNWWCVLFPQLCTAQATEKELYEDFIAAGFTAEQYRLIRNESGTRYKIRFRILEILAEWIGFPY